MTALSSTLAQLLYETIVPLIEADGGELYWVPSEASIHLHLSGACSGCPGARFTIQDVIKPLLKTIDASLPMKISVGWLIPDNAIRIQKTPESVV